MASRSRAAQDCSSRTDGHDLKPHLLGGVPYAEVLGRHHAPGALSYQQASAAIDQSRASARTEEASTT